MSNLVGALLEQELRRRSVPYRFDAESQRYCVQHQGRELLVTLENLTRSYARNQNTACIAEFVDNVLSARVEERPWEEVCSSILFALEPSDYAEPPPLRTPVSGRVDKVPVVVSSSQRTIAWITPAMIDNWQISLADVEAMASRNMSAALAAAELEYEEIDGVRLGFFRTELPFKASLILAPNLREVLSSVLGWPLYAVIPDRDFLYLWAARHRGFIDRVGGVVVKEFIKSAYPITTEVFEIGDHGVEAIGTFPTESS